MIDKLGLSKEESDLMFLDIQVMEYSALEAMTKVQGTIHDWRTLVDVFLVVLHKPRM